CRGPPGTVPFRAARWVRRSSIRSNGGVTADDHTWRLGGARGPAVSFVSASNAPAWRFTEMLSTMQDFPLTITAIFRHGRKVFGSSEVVTFEGESCRRASFAQVAERADRLAAALRRLGVREGDRVGTFAWNTQEHLEAYMAVPSMGAVLHTLNLRLFPEQLTYITNHAEDKVILVDATVIPLLARVASELKTVEQFVIMGEGDAGPLGGNVLSYEELLAAEP